MKAGRTETLKEGSTNAAMEHDGAGSAAVGNASSNRTAEAKDPAEEDGRETRDVANYSRGQVGATVGSHPIATLDGAAGRGPMELRTRKPRRQQRQKTTTTTTTTITTTATTTTTTTTMTTTTATTTTTTTSEEAGVPAGMKAGRTETLEEGSTDTAMDKGKAGSAAVDNAGSDRTVGPLRRRTLLRKMDGKQEMLQITRESRLARLSDRTRSRPLTARRVVVRWN